MTETFAEAVERLKNKENAKAFGFHTLEDRGILEKVGKNNCQVFQGNGFWGPGFSNERFWLGYLYVIRPDYQPEPKWSDRVFASTCDAEKDADNNTIGVTAHCKCGHVFTDDVVHGKHQKQPEPPKPEYIDIEIFSRCFELRCYANGRDLPISHLPSLEDFRGFFYSNERQEPGVPLDQVARRMAEGKKVVAHFERK